MRLASCELEQRLKAREPMACESVLQLYPEFVGNTEAILELVYLELLVRQEQGDNQALDNLLERFPTLSSEINKLVQVDRAMMHLQSMQDTESDKAFSENQVTRISSPPEVHSERIGNYELLEILGCGGMGVVYRARQLSLNRLVALKTVETLASFSPNVISRFQSEAELAARLQHPNIVQIYEIDVASGVPFFSMELVTGGSLAEAIRDAPLQPNVAAKLCETLAQAVHYAHSQGIIHRDLKPANILLAPSGRKEALDLQLETFHNIFFEQEPGTKFDPKIADFGLAKRLGGDSHATQTGATLGTPSYMAPEQVDATVGQCGPASDIYALGALLYHTLVGRPPFHAASAVETMHLVRHQDPVPLRKIQPKIPVDLETICLTCLAKEPQRRYPTAAALSADLRRYLSGQTIMARASGPMERAIKWARQHPSLTLLASVFLVASLATTYLWRRSELSRMAEQTQRTRAERLVYARDISLAHLEYRSNHVDRCEQILLNCDPEQRSWEWNYLKNLCQEHLWETPRFDFPVLSTTLSPDGRWLACSYGHWGRDQPEPIRIWNLRNRELAYELPVPPGTVHCVQFSPDSQWLLSCGISYANEKSQAQTGVAMWSLKDGSLIHRIESAEGVVARFLPDGNSFLVGKSTGTIEHYSCDTVSLLQSFRGHAGIVLDIAISQDGKTLISSAKDRSIRVWDLEHGKSRGELTKLVGDDPFELELSPDGSRLLVGGWAGSLVTYDRHGAGFKKVNSQRLTGLPHNRFTPDGLYLLTASYGEGAQLRDVHSGEVTYQIHTHAANIKSVAFDRTGRLVATGNSDGSTRLWDVTSVNRSISKSNTSGQLIAAVASNPRQPEIALATRANHLYPTASAKSIELRSLENLNQVRFLTGHEDWPSCVAYSADGRQLVSGSADRSVRVWDVASATDLEVLLGHEAPIVGANFLAAEGQLASADAGGKIIIWSSSPDAQAGLTGSAPSGYSIRKQWVTNQKLTSWCVPRHGRHVAVATMSGDIEVWDVATTRMVAKMTGGRPIRHMVLSPSGDALAVVREGSRSIELQDFGSLLQGRQSEPLWLAGHTDQVNSISFSRDGKRLVSSGRDEAIRLFDVSSGHELLNFHVARGLENLVHLSSYGDLVFAEEHRLYQVIVNRAKVDSPYAGNLEHTFESFLNPDSTIPWHEQQLKKAKANGDNWANLFHRLALAELRPATAAELLARGYQRAYRGDLLGACRDAQAAIAIKDDRYYHGALALFQLNLGSFSEYQQECQSVIALTDSTGSLTEINAALWTIAFSEQSGIELDVWIEHLKVAYSIAKSKGPSPVKGLFAGVENTLGLAAYRCGQYEAAIEHNNASLKLGGLVPAMDHAILAMAYFRLDQIDKARQSLARAQSLLAEMQQAEDSGMVLSSIQRTAKALELPVLLKEAEDLLEGRE